MKTIQGEISQIKYLLQKQSGRFLVDDKDQKRAYVLLKKINKEHKSRLFDALQDIHPLDKESLYIRENEKIAVLIIEPLFDVLTMDVIKEIKNIIIKDDINVKKSQIDELIKYLN
jgi:hypothetical protein